MTALKNSLLFPAIQSVHLIGIALFVGTIVLVDLRLLGYAMRSYNVAELTDRFARFRRTGLAIMLTTGPFLFAADIPRYIHNPAFIIKMAILLVALGVQFGISEKHNRLVAVVSIVLWTCVVLGGRAIADFDI
jgi:uncharacterized protein DUF6644